jgi:hypothetical protein
LYGAQKGRNDAANFCKPDCSSLQSLSFYSFFSRRQCDNVYFEKEVAERLIYCMMKPETATQAPFTSPCECVRGRLKKGRKKEVENPGRQAIKH